MGVLGRPSGKEDRGSRTMDEDQQQCGNGTKMDEASDVRRGVGGETDSDDEHDEHDKAGYSRKEKDESDNEAGERNAEDDVEILVTKPLLLRGKTLAAPTDPPLMMRRGPLRSPRS